MMGKNCMPPEKTEYLKQWLRKAREDLEMAEAALQLEKPLTEPSLFHAQQAAEKSLKALLTFHNVAFRKIHDLNKLGREATWEEAVANYKSLLVGRQAGTAGSKDLMRRFNGYLERLKKCQSS